MKFKELEELKQIPEMAVITTSGNALFSRLIRFWTGKKGSHTAIYIGKGKHLIAESGSLGNVIRRLEKYFRKNIKIWIYVKPALTQEQIMLMKDYLYETLGRKYDWKGVIRFIFKGVKQDPDRNYCTEWITEIYNAGNVFIPEGLSPGGLVDWMVEEGWKLVFYRGT